MSIQKCFLLLCAGLFMGIASGMDDAASETRQTLALLLHCHNKCNKYTIEPKIQLNNDMCAFIHEMREFVGANCRSSTFHKDMDFKRFEFGSTERGAEIVLEAEVAELQWGTLYKDPFFAGKTRDEIYSTTLLLDLNEKPALDEIAGNFRITEYEDKKHLAAQIKDKYALKLKAL